MKKQSCVQKDLPAEVSVETGQTLLEILLALSVSVTILSAVILSVITSLSNAQYAKNQGLANSYAQEGMTVVRRIRDSGWSDLENMADNFPAVGSFTRYCFGLNAVELGSPIAAPDCGQNVGIFSREVQIDHLAEECCSDNSPSCSTGTKGSKIMIKVSWPDNKCPAGAGNPYCHKVELTTCMFGIDLKPTP